MQIAYRLIEKHNISVLMNAIINCTTVTCHYILSPPDHNRRPIIGVACCKSDRRSPERKLLDKLLSKHRVLIFGKSDCPFTLQMRQLFSKLGVMFTTIEVDKCCDDKFKQYLVTHTRLSTVPQVFIDGKFIGGASHVLKKHENGDLKVILCHLDPQCLAAAHIAALKKKCNPVFIRPKPKIVEVSSSSSSSSSSTCPIPPNYDPCAPKVYNPDCDKITKVPRLHKSKHRSRNINMACRPTPCTSCAR
ncbi:uncharacterized protein LOC106662214 isoform X2 [Cimex lectularius]|uniref:Glutaredoxin domain-containing protein n=1 Tax=Cimex lectularius TaxID=79782 RepID=A0A8I6RBQ6_CIMLE|nr:uncharacterized protein LOC106662214 isoform X2 [Cimex lectularius]